MGLPPHSRRAGHHGRRHRPLERLGDPEAPRHRTVTAQVGADTVLLPRLYVLVFIHHNSRLVRIAGITSNPVASWVAQQAREPLDGPRRLGERAQVPHPHYNAHRPHRSLSQRAPCALDTAPALIGDVDLARLRRADRLGGLVHEYPMVA